MTRRFQSITNLLLIAIVAGLTCTATRASAQHISRVTIPFAFTANHQRLPPGYYQVQLSSEHFLTFVDARTGRFQTNLMVRSDYDRSTPETQGSLVFVLNGGRYFLTEVRFAGTNMHSKMAVQPRAEWLSAQNQQPAGSTIEIASK